MNGWIILDKPTGISSAHAVAKVKRLLRPDKIGHAGTLDPLASGILPLALGEATKTVSYMMDASKSYAFSVTWGQERATDDSEGEILLESPKRPSKQEIEILLPEFTGNISQIPPDYSAIKLEGKRAYDLARSGHKIEIKPREIFIKSLEINNFTPEITDFTCYCGKGTYIRSLARDMGRMLGCYGYISSLRRLSTGKFNETHAISLENLADMVHKGEVDFLQPVESALDDILARDISSTQALRLRRGQTVEIPDSNPGNNEGVIIFAHENGKAVAICKLQAGVMKPVRVFNL